MHVRLYFIIKIHLEHLFGSMKIIFVLLDKKIDVSIGFLFFMIEYFFNWSVFIECSFSIKEVL